MPFLFLGLRCPHTPYTSHIEQHWVSLPYAASSSSEGLCKQSQEIEKLIHVVEYLSTHVASFVTASNVDSAKTEITCFRFSKLGHSSRESNGTTIGHNTHITLLTTASHLSCRHLNRIYRR